MDHFVRSCNRLLHSGSKPALNVIHGKGHTPGSGIIRETLRRYLRRNCNLVRYMTGEDYDGNPGHTLVWPLGPLPFYKPSTRSTASLTSLVEGNSVSHPEEARQLRNRSKKHRQELDANITGNKNVASPRSKTPPAGRESRNSKTPVGSSDGPQVSLDEGMRRRVYREMKQRSRGGIDSIAAIQKEVAVVYGCSINEVKRILREGRSKGWTIS
jgi:hypothetical protein